MRKVDVLSAWLIAASCPECDPRRMSDEKDAAVLVRMSRDQRDQLTALAAEEGVTVRAYVLHHLLGASYEDLPLVAGGQPRHRRAPRNQPVLPEAGDAAA